MLATIDTETTGTDFFHGCRPFMVLANNGHKNIAWTGTVDPTNRNVYWDSDVLNNLQNFINNLSKVVFHNLNFDRRALESINIYLPEFNPVFNPNPTQQLHDTLAAWHCLSSGDLHGLKPTCYKLFDYPETDESELQDSINSLRDTSQGIDIAREGHPHFPALKNQSWYKMDYWLDMPRCLKYGGGDVERTFLLHKECQKELTRCKLNSQYEFRMQLLPALYDLQTNGINVNIDRINRLLELNIWQLEEIRKNLQSIAGNTMFIDPGKDASLKHLIHSISEIPILIYTKDGKPSFSKETLIEYERIFFDKPAIPLLKAWRKCNKQVIDLHSWKDWCVVTTNPSQPTSYRIHSNLNATGTKWTRQSSSNPNQQNFNKELDYLFSPPENHYWLYADVVNIELCIWAYEVGSKALIAEFERGRSVHLIIANILYPELIAQLGEAAFKETKTYTRCKSGTFARMYGGGNHKVDTTYGIPNASAIVDAKLPEIGMFFKRCEKQRLACDEKYDYPMIYTRQGYRLDVPRNSPHKAVSGRIQGAAGLIVQDMMIQIQKDPFIKSRSGKMIQQVHDSLKLEFPIHADSTTTNAYCIDLMEATGKKHMPTCRMDTLVINYDPNYIMKSTDWITVEWFINDGEDRDFRCKLYIYGNQFLAKGVLDKEIYTAIGKTREEAKTNLLQSIQEPPF